MAAKKKGGGKGSTGVALIRILRILDLLPYPPNEGLTVAQICSKLREFDEYSDPIHLSDAALTKSVQRDLKGLLKQSQDLDVDSDDAGEMEVKNQHMSSVLLDSEFGVALELNGRKWRHEIGTKPLPLKNLSEEQRLILAMSDRYLRQFLPQETYKEMAPMFSRALGSSGLQAGKIKLYLDSIGWVVPGVTRYPPTDRDLRPQNLSRISEALFQQCQVKFRYQKPSSSAPEEYHLHPIGLIQRGYRYILVGIKQSDYDQYLIDLRDGKKSHALLQKTRQFISNRFVGDIEVLLYEQNGKYLPSLQEVLDAGTLNFTQGYSQSKGKLRLRFSNNSIGKRFVAQFEEQPISLDQQIAINDGFTELTATVIESIELQWLLQGMASGVKVIEGSETLKEKIKQFSQAAYELQHGK